MADFKKLTVDGNTYDVKDAQARSSASNALSVATAAQMAADSKLPIVGTVTGSAASKATIMMSLGSTGANSISELRAGNGVNDSFIQVKDNGDAKFYGSKNVKIESESNDISVNAAQNLHLTAAYDFNLASVSSEIYTDHDDVVVDAGNDVLLNTQGDVKINNEIAATQPWVLNNIPAGKDPSPLPLNIPYNFRTVPDINAIKKTVTLVGGTVCWNQLVQATDTSCTVTNGHKYISFLSGTWAVGSSDGSAFTVDGANGDKVFDLTLMFGSTIADYIYGLGNTDGVAWFQNLFPLSTYAYNAGTLYSVNPDQAITENVDQSETNTYELNHQTLYGLYKLDGNNRLYADGDTYDHDGTITRRYAVVDLGDLFYTYNSTNQWFSTNSIDTLIKKPSGGNVVANIFTDKYDRISRTALGNDLTLNLRVAVSTAGSVIIRDLSYTDPDVFKTAMSGHKLVYELTTPTTETVATFDEEMTVYPDGTEALTDYAYTQGQRDVQIPVGNNTLYERKVIAVPAAPITPGSYYLAAYVDNDGKTYYTWEA